MNRRARARAAIAGGLVLSVIAIASCDSTSKSAGRRAKQTPSAAAEAAKSGSEVLADASRALASAPIVHMIATSAGRAVGGKPTYVSDLRVQQDGAAGSVRLQDDLTVQTLTVKGKSYVRGDASFFGFLNLSKAQLASISGRWVTFPGPVSTADAEDQDVFVSPNDIRQVAQKVMMLGTGVNVRAAVSSGFINRRPVVIVHESDGSALFVSAVGNPLPLQIIGGSGDSGLSSESKVTFSYEGTPAQLRSPAGAVPIPDPSP